MLILHKTLVLGSNILKLNDPKTAPKNYWLIFRIFGNSSKIPLIPSLIVNNEFVTDLVVKAKLFNDFFRAQYRPITNHSSLSNNQTVETVIRLSNINIDTDAIIKSFVHDCQSMSSSMSISKSLHILFNNSVINGCFPNEWKKTNIILEHKKGGKQITKNYRPVSLLPICSKMLEKNIFKIFFEIFRG